MFKFKKKELASNEDKKLSWVEKLKNGLAKTRSNFYSGIEQLIHGKKEIDPELLEELETQLLLADVGIETTGLILDKLTEEVSRDQLRDPQALIQSLKSNLVNLLDTGALPPPSNNIPYVILMVGVNGAGKTTSIAKIAHFYKSQGKSVMLAAGDTFRAAATEQLEVWGKRNEIHVVSQEHGADSAAVIFDALQSAQAKKCDILIADTAGRLHTQGHLMNELKKIKRVISKLDQQAPHEVMLVLDASMGQNALTQAKQFDEQIGIDSVTITKLDGTAKGGIIFSIANALNRPYRFIGVGESIDDLKPFDANEFVTALFDN